ncbi:DNA (cytosine-5-)-methyltransferase [Erysipelotrichaceae bacterium OH741_COT-311]|nr:DNA (cytosine-5-)-methyltransferase [Erysipelotrichaceae bacterium OH741_COT-311]
MKKTVCELFAGVGGFRCGLNHITSIEDTNKKERWKTTWFSQWEPLEKTTQWAHSCYVNRFKTCLDLQGNDTTNVDINTVKKIDIPDHNLLVGGFPCQDYSVASSLATSKGLEGKKGILWWDIRDILETKKPAFVLLENVDRLIKSPARQRGRDFGVILACFKDLGYSVEWRVINAAEYGYQQRRKRIFIFAYQNNTKYARKISKNIKYHLSDEENLRSLSAKKVIFSVGFFANSFTVACLKNPKIKTAILPDEIGEVSSSFYFEFENSGLMKDGIIYTAKTEPNYVGNQITLGDILEDGYVSETFFIPKNKLYYTDKNVKRSDETKERLPVEKRKTWQYIKGGKKLPRKSKEGHSYIYSEGAISMIDTYNKPARTMLTNEGGFSRSTHIVEDRRTGEIRLLTAIEMERIQGFPSDWTKEAVVDGKIVEVPLNKRRFMMGNALVVNLISQMEEQLSDIFEKE